MIEGQAGLEGLLGTAALRIAEDGTSRPLPALTGEFEHAEDDDIIDAEYSVCEDSSDDHLARNLRDAA